MNNNNRDAQAMNNLASNMGTEIARLNIQLAKQEVIITEMQAENSELKMQIQMKEGDKNGTKPSKAKSKHK